MNGVHIQQDQTASTNVSSALKTIDFEHIPPFSWPLLNVLFNSNKFIGIIRATSVISLITLIWATSAIVDNGKSMLIDMNIDDDFYYHNGRMHKDFYADADRYEERYGRMAQNTQKYIPYCTSDGHVIDPSIFFKPKSVTNSDAFVKKEVAPTRTCHASDDAASSKCWMPWLEGSVIPFLFTGCTVLAVLQFLIFSPHLHMLFNLLFSLWRMQNYDYKFDCILSLGFSLYGIGRLGYDLHCTIRDSFDRWIKMHLMDLVNR